jgi:glyoxylase-like metal-dependent hydrolase (beta-lactamase superfamily II)
MHDMSDGDRLLSWQVGRVKITRIAELEIPIAYDAAAPFMRDAEPEALRTMPWLYPHFVTEQGALILSVHALLVEAPGLKLVVDTCIGNDRPREITGGVALQTPFLQRLAEAGWSRDGVDAVVCTHLHVDHVGWNTMLEAGRWVPTFPNARYLIGRAELAHWRAEGDAAQQVILGDSVQPIFDAGLAELVETDHRLSPEVWLEPTPGHTPGHVSVVIESQGQRAVISGDFLHHPCQIAHPEWPSGSDIDPDLAVATRRAALDRAADQQVLFIGTHFATPTAGYIRRRDGDLRLEV